MTTRRRCAIYTRKSTEEGLEQDFNSLHAQREACEAFIRSQRHEGWQVLPEAYDDGGWRWPAICCRDLLSGSASCWPDCSVASFFKRPQSLSRSGSPASSICSIRKGLVWSWARTARSTS